MDIYQETLNLVSDGKKDTRHFPITEIVNAVIVRSSFYEGIVIVHTLHTTTALSQKGGRRTGYIVQENEGMLMDDFEAILNEGAEKLLAALPQIMSERDKFLDFFPPNLLSTFLGFLTNLLRPTGYWQHDDFSIRTQNMHPDERKNATAHVKASMMREALVWGFSECQLNLGRWQDIIFWDFDAKDRPSRKIQVVVIGK